MLDLGIVFVSINIYCFKQVFLLWGSLYYLQQFWYLHQGMMIESRGDWSPPRGAGPVSVRLLRSVYRGLVCSVFLVGWPVADPHCSVASAFTAFNPDLWALSGLLIHPKAELHALQLVIDMWGWQPLLISPASPPWRACVLPFQHSSCRNHSTTSPGCQGDQSPAHVSDFSCSFPLGE